MSNSDSKRPLEYRSAQSSVVEVFEKPNPSRLAIASFIVRVVPTLIYAVGLGMLMAGLVSPPPRDAFIVIRFADGLAFGSALGTMFLGPIWAVSIILAWIDRRRLRKRAVIDGVNLLSARVFKTCGICLITIVVMFFASFIYGEVTR